MSHISRAKDGVAILVTKSPLANGNTPRVVKADCFSYGMVGQRVALICSVQVRFCFLFYLYYLTLKTYLMHMKNDVINIICK